MKIYLYHVFLPLYVSFWFRGFQFSLILDSSAHNSQLNDSISIILNINVEYNIRGIHGFLWLSVVFNFGDMLLIESHGCNNFHHNYPLFNILFNIL